MRYVRAFLAVVALGLGAVWGSSVTAAPAVADGCSYDLCLDYPTPTGVSQPLTPGTAL